MNIYEIDNAMMSLIDEETGEIKDFSAFEELQMQREHLRNVVSRWKTRLKI